MPRVRSAVVLVGLALGFAGSGVARSDDPPPAAADAIRQQEADARAKSAAEMTDLAKFCERRSSFDDARKAAAASLRFSPDDAALKAEAARLETKKGTPRPIAAGQIAAQRAKNLAKCTELLAPVALAYAEAQRTDDLGRVLALLRSVGAPAPKLDIAFFEPYLEWHSKKDIDLLQAGSEYVDGAWIDAAKLAEMNAAHADWANPWIAADDATEVRTTISLRVARQTLAHASATRRVFLRYFAGEWDLVPPAAKLRINVMATRGDLDARLHIESPMAQPAAHDAVAWYADTPQAGNPCFVCFEALDPRDKSIKLDFNGIRWSLAHEVAHQVAFEYSKHAKGQGRLTHAAAWAIEGLAEFAPYLDSVDGECVVTRPNGIPWRGHDVDSAFNWCRTNEGKIPPLEELIKMPRSTFLKGEDNGRIAATLAWYLLEADGRGHRRGFVKYLERVHQDRDEADTFTECMGTVDLRVLDGDFRKFVRSIRMDEK